MTALRRANFEHTNSFVYFIASSSGVKIGQSKDPEARLKQLQGSHSDSLILLGVLAGDTDLEAELHKEFSESRLRGEWFRITPRMRHLVKAAYEAGTGKPWATEGDTRPRGMVYDDDLSNREIAAQDMSRVDELALLLGITPHACREMLYRLPPGQS